MARLRRHFLVGAVHHAISRFHGGAYRLQTPSEREEYLRRLAANLAKTDWHLLAYALMSTHLHLVLQAGKLAPRRIFQSTHGGFAMWLNKRQSMFGQLFAGRYRLWAVQRPTSELIAYVHNNPVRAGVVDQARGSTWTSHRHYLSPELAPDWLSVELGMNLSGCPDSASFDHLVLSEISTPRDPVWRGERDCTAVQEIHGAAGAAVEVSEPVVCEGLSYLASVRPRAFAELCSDYTPEQVLGAIEVVVGLVRREFCGRRKSRAAVRARCLALRVWRGMRGSQVEMSAALGMSSSAAASLLQSGATHHRQGDVDKVWLELLRRYPQGI